MPGPPLTRNLRSTNKEYLIFYSCKIVRLLIDSTVKILLPVVQYLRGNRFYEEPHYY